MSIFSIDKSTSAREVNKAISESLDEFDDVLAVNSEPLASCDFLGTEASSIVDTTQRRVSHGHLIKLMISLDNELAFTNRMVDISLRQSDFVAEESSSEQTKTNSRYSRQKVNYAVDGPAFARRETSSDSRGSQRPIA